MVILYILVYPLNLAQSSRALNARRTNTWLLPHLNLPMLACKANLSNTLSTYPLNSLLYLSCDTTLGSSPCYSPLPHLLNFSSSVISELWQPILAWFCSSPSIFIKSHCPSDKKVTTQVTRKLLESHSIVPPDATPNCGCNNRGIYPITVRGSGMNWAYCNIKTLCYTV